MGAFLAVTLENTFLLSQTFQEEPLTRFGIGLMLWDKDGDSSGNGDSNNNINDDLLILSI